MTYNVSISSNDKNGNMNLNLPVEAANVFDALDKAKEQLTATMKASGLGVVPA